jgi:hypothetical protein
LLMTCSSISIRISETIMRTGHLAQTILERSIHISS